MSLVATRIDLEARRVAMQAQTFPGACGLQCNDVPCLELQGAAQANALDIAADSAGGHDTLAIGVV